MKTYTVTKARSDISKIMDQVVLYGEPVQITTAKGKGGLSRPGMDTPRCR